MIISKKKLKKMLEDAKAEGFNSAITEAGEYIQEQMADMTENIVNNLSEIGNNMVKPYYIYYRIKPDDFGNWGVDVSEDVGQYNVKISFLDVLQRLQ